MPTYNYECQKCGHAFELFQSMTAPVKRKCPECSERSLERLIGPGAGFIFKGDGFYITDYRSDSYKAGEKAAKDTPSTPEPTKKKDSGTANGEKTEKPSKKGKESK